MKLTHYQVPDWGTEGELIHGFLGRGGGNSLPPYAGLNVSYRVGDDPSRVKKNVCDLKKELGLHGLRIVMMKQCHGDRIIDVTEPLKDAGEGDAMVSCSTGLLLGVLTADCTPVLLWSQSGGRTVAAVVHAGWRGSLAGLSAKVVGHLEKRYGVEPPSLSCALGPSIDDCCSEVGADVSGPLAERWGDTANSCMHTVNGRTHVSLRRLNAAFLAGAGVPRQQIHLVGPCTACTPREFFSHRRETKARIPQTGRQISLIGWLP
jgi:YfiH family protein